MLGSAGLIATKVHRSAGRCATLSLLNGNLGEIAHDMGSQSSLATPWQISAVCFHPQPEMLTDSYHRLRG